MVIHPRRSSHGLLREGAVSVLVSSTCRRIRVPVESVVVEAERPCAQHGQCRVVERLHLDEESCVFQLFSKCNVSAECALRCETNGGILHGDELSSLVFRLSLLEGDIRTSLCA